VLTGGMDALVTVNEHLFPLIYTVESIHMGLCKGGVGGVLSKPVPSPNRT